MGASGAKTLPTIAFFTVVENEELGFTGGLLILNLAGRPVEFHCTAPLKPNRAQEILYGPTLRPFLYGEQIGQTLLAKVKTEPLFVCTNVSPALCMRDCVDRPLLFVHDEQTGHISTDPARSPIRTGERTSHDQPSGATRFDQPLVEFILENRQVAVLAEHRGDRQTVEDCFQQRQHAFDLGEPFLRIREALEEAQRGAAK